MTRSPRPLRSSGLQSLLILMLAAGAMLAADIAPPTRTDVFDARKLGYYSHRLPGLLFTKAGTLLAYCEARRGKGDDYDHSEIILRRSADRGKTWSDVQVIAGPADCIRHNPVLIADLDGSIHFVYCTNYSRCFYRRSEDDGRTWTPPVEITDTFDQFKSDYKWNVIATGPPHGIQLTSGRLIVPVWLSTGGPHHRPSVVSTVYSDDHGKSWHRGEIAVPNADGVVNPNETVAVQLADGRVMLNSRNESAAHRRVIVMSPDGATHWSKPTFVDDLTEPICAASMVRLTMSPLADHDRLLFANPNNTDESDKVKIGEKWTRKNLTVRLSYDEGKTWPIGKSMWPGLTGYSDLAVGPGGIIYCLYEHAEGGRSMYLPQVLTLAKFSLAWLTDGRDSLDKSADNHPPRGYSIPVVDLTKQTDHQVVVDRERGQYLGHVTTVLLDDHKTIIAVYPKGHGAGAIVMKRSTDGGLTWSTRLATPANWATSREVPTIYKTVDANGDEHLILFSGRYPIRMAHSEDEGRTWTPLEKIGDYGGIVAMASVVKLHDGPGRYMAMFHDDGRYIHNAGKATKTSTLYQVFSSDGGLTWSAPREILHRSDVFLCEPGAVRSPDGKQIAVLLRENDRRRNSFVIFSDDEGRTWTQPRELPGALTGDRHTLKYTPDGHLVCVFRDTCLDSPTQGDFVAWVGTYEDIVKGREGICRVRLMDNTAGADCGYPGLEVLPDGTIVATTYGHWTKGEKPWIVCVRFKLADVRVREK